MDVGSPEPGDDAADDVDPGAPGEPGTGPVASGIEVPGLGDVGDAPFGIETGGRAGGMGIVRSPPGLAIA
jgi:hypothetical protein